MVKPLSVTKRNIVDVMDKAFGIVYTPHQGWYTDRKYPLSGSGKRIKQISFTPFLGDVDVKKWPQFFYLDAQSSIFRHLKVGTFGKSAHFWVLKNRTLRS